MAVEKILADNYWRLDKFATRTSITESDGRKVVYKTALTEEARCFLKQIIDSERKNVGYLERQFEVLCGTLDGNRIEYEYLPFPSLQDTIAEYLRHGDYVAANEIFNRYVDKLHSLETITIVPQEFFQTIVGNTSNKDLEMYCLSCGLLDLTPRNILIDGERWIVLDNEWSFNFPVPVSFVLFRAVFMMAIALQAEIRRATCKLNPSLGVFKNGLKAFYVPTRWIEHIVDWQGSFPRMLQWEAAFQTYVLGGEYRPIISLAKMPQKQRIHFSIPSVMLYSSAVKKLKMSIRGLPGIQWISNYLNRLALYIHR